MQPPLQWRSNKCYSECVCIALGIRHCQANASFYIVTWPTRLYHFSALARRRNDFREKKVTEHKMWVLIFPTGSVCNISLSKNS